MSEDNPVATGPRRLLSIDGGGLLGLIPAEALVQIEQQLDRITGKPEPLCNRFDLIGGTSEAALFTRVTIETTHANSLYRRHFWPSGADDCAGTPARAGAGALHWADYRQRGKFCCRVRDYPFAGG